MGLSVVPLASFTSLKMEKIVRYPTDPAYDHVPSYLRMLQSGPRQNRYMVMHAAASHLQQLSSLSEYLGEREVEELARQFPAVPRELIAGISSHATPRREETLKLPHIPSASPRSSAARAADPRWRPLAIKPMQKPVTKPVTKVVARAQPASSRTVRPPPREAAARVDDLVDAMLPSTSAMQLSGAGSPPIWGAESDAAMEGPPAPVLSPGLPSEIYHGGPVDGDGARSGAADGADAMGVSDTLLWEENPALLAPALLLREQSISLLVERREHALEGLRGLLHSLSRVVRPPVYSKRCAPCADTCVPRSAHMRMKRAGAHMPYALSASCAARCARSGTHPIGCPHTSPRLTRHASSTPSAGTASPPPSLSSASCIHAAPSSRR